MTSTDSATLRTMLEAERDDLARSLGELGVNSPTAPDFDENFADSAQVTAELGENQALAANLRDQIHDIEHALTRIEEGTYGTCEFCGEPIAAARLEAMPAARFCIDHA
ncbi:MAG: TraR/DksA C4-type zinc finger protein [Aquihabitans sp.]